MTILSITAFLGRFHPVVVHLPIGFILLAIILEWRKKGDGSGSSVSYAWLLSAISSGIAALLGWFLANQGAYDNWTLFAHRWLGIFIGLFSLYAWYVRRNKTPSSLVKRVTNIGALIVLLITGHLGGNMTHGSDYLLEYAPKPIQKLLGYGATSNDYPQYLEPDSVIVYPHLIQPTLERKCWSCHNDDVQNGGLNMTSFEALQKGGDGGPVIVAGDIGSELIRRVTLPTSSSKFMPSSGTPLTYHEIKLLEWWISEGADYQAVASNMSATPSIKKTLLDLFGLDLTPKPWIEKKKVSTPTKPSLELVNKTGIEAQMISGDNGWVEVSLPYGKQIQQEQLKSLTSIAEQVTWLKLSNSGLTDGSLSFLRELTHLTKLKLDGNPITTEGLMAFADLSHLETLNLTNTEIDDQIFDMLDKMPNLKSLYLWKSNVTDDAVKQAKEKYNNIDIILGSNPI